MPGFAFDVRIMTSDRGLLFVTPGIDLGLVYSPGTRLVAACVGKLGGSACKSDRLLSAV
jgi:hypothetical protein